MRTRLENKPLTTRMEQIVRRLALGMSLGEIAEDIDLSPSTVSVYAFRLLQRYGLKRSIHLPGEVEYRSWGR